MSTDYKSWFKDKNVKTTSPGCSGCGGCEPRVEAFFTIIFSLFFCFLINRFYDDISFIKPGFSDILWAINLSVYIGVALNLVRIVLPLELLKSIINIIGNVFTVYISWFLLTNFPFDFREWVDLGIVNPLAKLVLLLLIIAVIIATIVEIFKLPFSTLKGFSK